MSKILPAVPPPAPSLPPKFSRLFMANRPCSSCAKTPPPTTATTSNRGAKRFRSPRRFSYLHVESNEPTNFTATTAPARTRLPLLQYVAWPCVAHPGTTHPRPQRRHNAVTTAAWPRLQPINRKPGWTERQKRAGTPSLFSSLLKPHVNHVTYGVRLLVLFLRTAHLSSFFAKTLARNTRKDAPLAPSFLPLSLFLHAVSPSNSPTLHSALRWGAVNTVVAATCTRGNANRRLVSPPATPHQGLFLPSSFSVVFGQPFTRLPRCTERGAVQEHPLGVHQPNAALGRSANQ